MPVACLIRARPEETSAGSYGYLPTRPRPIPLAGPPGCQTGALQDGGQAERHGDALAGPAGLRDGQKRDTPTTSRRATTRRPEGRAERGRPPVASRAAPGPTRGRAAPGRRDATRAAVRFGGANPERTTCHRLPHRETHKHKDTAHRVHDGTACQQTAARVRVRDEEVVAESGT